MDPPAPRRAVVGAGLPRTRGDGPYQDQPRQVRQVASPHTRGWTRRSGRRLRCGGGFPAHAGMDPSRIADRNVRKRLPRTRGDGPRVQQSVGAALPASPHTRGWTRHRVVLSLPLAGFPAHAGMDPQRTRTGSGRSRLPRTRGDGPRSSWASRRRLTASPHTRGWTRSGASGLSQFKGFPAHAGMDRAGGPSLACRVRLPRTRGDGPCAESEGGRVTTASPHTRGWTPLARVTSTSGAGFPAHAGMDPGFGTTSR